MHVYESMTALRFGHVYSCATLLMNSMSEDENVNVSNQCMLEILIEQLYSMHSECTIGLIRITIHILADHIANTSSKIPVTEIVIGRRVALKGALLLDFPIAARMNTKIGCPIN